jgi:dipeptidyl aminopeptidase/acylaminoacyl peptidase
VTRERQKLDAVTRSDVEGLWYEGADGDLVHGFLMKPPEFDAEARYPLLLLVHGGPQSAFFDQFHFRWNASVFAGAGFVVAMLNPRGSVGYGSRFTDQISGDWGGRCYEDLMRGVDAILSRFSFVEEDRMVAAGGSFGGFMISWIAGHTDRFRALVCHDGIFNQESMSYTTDELWFDIWEHGGVPFDDPERFRRQSPHLVVDRMNTPMLVVQGERDYRCPVGEGIALFTALQMRGVPSRLLYFEDEGHFVTKPANAQVWYETVIQFLRSYV